MPRTASRLTCRNRCSDKWVNTGAIIKAVSESWSSSAGKLASASYSRMLDMALSSIGGLGVVHLNHATVGRAIQLSKDLWVITRYVLKYSSDLGQDLNDSDRCGDESERALLLFARPILDRLREMRRLHTLASSQIRDRVRPLQHPVTLAPALRASASAGVRPRARSVREQISQQQSRRSVQRIPMRALERV
jgi:hypothetical protein